MVVPTKAILVPVAVMLPELSMANLAVAPWIKEKLEPTAKV